METTLPNIVHFGREICGVLEAAERREWWLSNGRGAYAAGTVAGSLTRRYHGLLIAPVNPPLGRVLCFARADAVIHDQNGRSWSLATNRWGGGLVDPHGHEHIESFRLDGRMPVWTYALNGLRLEQCIWLEPGEHTVYVAFRLLPGAGMPEQAPQLSMKLLINARDFHGSTRPGAFYPDIVSETRQLQIRHADWFNFDILCTGGTLDSDCSWYENFDLPVEHERGLPDRDAHLCVGVAQLTLNPGEWVGVVGSLEPDASSDLEQAMHRYQSHDSAQLQRARAGVTELSRAPAWIDQLVLAADSFLFARPLDGFPDGESVIAGYPWFGDWGRDTMIALPGLTLATGRFNSARRILETFARFVDQGMLPNVFPGSGETPEYNSVDAALWYIEAWRDYMASTGDLTALRAVFPVLESIIDWHRRGTRYHIGMDDDGLLHAGEPGVQLTWMDAKVGDWVVTPRIGKPVEINALWYNALRCMATFAEALGLDASAYREQAERTSAGFQRFILPDARGLYDVLDGPQGDDDTLRPNQIFAVSLAHSPLDPTHQADIVALCARTLLTSFGLRSLHSDHADFRPVYQGGVWERDGAYHQGPVWGWLLGHYALAEFRVSGDAAAAQSRLLPLRDHLNDAGLGSISEIFDGAPPHTPRGCPAQAWSVACTLQAWCYLEQAKQAVTTDSNSNEDLNTVTAPQRDEV